MELSKSRIVEEGRLENWSTTEDASQVLGKDFAVAKKSGKLEKKHI